MPAIGPACSKRIAALDEQQAAAVAGGGPRYVARHRERGKLLARERIELLLDRDAPFLELSSVAAYGTGLPVGASIVTGVGVVSGVECVITAHDPTVRGGASNPWTWKKVLRALEISRENRLPLVNIVESGGGDLTAQAEPVSSRRVSSSTTSPRSRPPASRRWRSSSATRRRGAPTCRACADYAVMVKERAKVFLGGPPLVKMAIGEDADDESLGGAEMHSRVSGLSDYFARDELDCLRIGRDIVEHLNWRKLGPAPTMPADEPLYSADELAGIVSIDLKVPFDPREVLARVIDGSRFEEYKPLYGQSLVTGWASVHGYLVGILANAQGVLFSEEAHKATEFILLCNQTDTPLVFLQNTTGYMVGTRYEQRGIIKDGAKMINAVTNSAVPHITINMGASYGAGNYGMSGRSYAPRFLFTWPNAKTAIMGPEQLAGVMSIVARQSAANAGREFDEEADATSRRQLEEPSRGRIVGDVHERSRLRRRCDRSARHPHGAGDRTVGRPLQRSARATRLRRLPDVDRGHQPTARREPGERSPVASCARARAMGIETVAVYSDADAGAPFVHEADVAVPLGGAAPAESYLRADAVLDAATRAGADAVHPGYGFLSENASFAQRVVDAGLTWVGPAAGGDRRDGIQTGGARVDDRGRCPGRARSRPRRGLRRRPRRRRRSARPTRVGQSVVRRRRSGHAARARCR